MQDQINELRVRALILGPSSNEARAVHEYDKLKLLGGSPVAVQHSEGWLIVGAMDKTAFSQKCVIDKIAEGLGGPPSLPVIRGRLPASKPRYTWIFNRVHRNHGRVIGRKFLTDTVVR